MNDWIEIGRIEDIPPQGARVIRTAQGDIAIFRTATDEIFALRDRCPHKGGPLSQGIVSGKTVTCPLHNGNLARDTGEAVAPDDGCAGHFPVKVVEGRISVLLSTERAKLAVVC
jgi:nitrite reductase (NADH) small subunit